MRILFLNIVVLFFFFFFFYFKGSLSNGGVFNRCVYRDEFLSVKGCTGSVEIASRFHGVNFSLLYTITYLHCLFSSFPLIFWKNECRIGGFPPPPLLFSQSHSLFLKTGENFKDQEEHMVFKKVRLFETPSLGKDLLTSLPVRSPLWLTCYLTQCVLDTPPASISLSREFVK